MVNGEVKGQKMLEACMIGKRECGNVIKVKDSYVMSYDCPVLDISHARGSCGYPMGQRRILPTAILSSRLDWQAMQ